MFNRITAGVLYRGRGYRASLLVLLVFVETLVAQHDLICLYSLSGMKHWM